MRAGGAGGMRSVAPAVRRAQMMGECGDAYQELYRMMIALLNHSGSGPSDDLPVIDMTAYNTDIRAMFLLTFGEVPTITLNMKVWQGKIIGYDVLTALAHEMVHWCMWRRGKDWQVHDGQFWDLAIEMFNHSAMHTFEEPLPIQISGLYTFPAM